MFVLAGAQNKGPEKHQILIASVRSPTVRCCLLAQAECLGRWRPVMRPSTPHEKTHSANVLGLQIWGPIWGLISGPAIRIILSGPKNGTPKTDPKTGPQIAIIVASKTLHSNCCPSSFWPTARRTRWDQHSWGPEVRNQVFCVFTAMK